MNDDSAHLSGQVALITGAGTGIGRVLARQYAVAGAAVVIAARRRDPLEETAALVEADGGTAHVIPGDLRSEDFCIRLVSETLDRFSRLDVLLNNAAVPGTDQVVAEMDLANWEDTIATNLTAPMLLSREALRQAMIPAGHGNIQLFSSAAAKSVVPRKAHYAAAKLGLIPFAQTLAMEVGEFGIRVNTLVIGTVAGELLEGYMARIAGDEGVGVDEIRSRFASGSALERFVEPEEVAATSLWLASDAASAITGQDINVTAGAEKR